MTKQFSYFILLIIVILFSCNESSEDSWSEEDKAIYQNVMSLQEQATDNFQTWIQAMDTAEAIQQLQAFFLADPSVVSAEIGSQGLAVQYTNGIRGGLFIYPEDEFETDSAQSELPQFTATAEMPQKALVANKNAIFLNPHYWDRTPQANGVIASYNQNLPKAGFALQKIYKGIDASLDRFTQLSDFGIIHIYSHGYAWPDKNNLQEVYLLTGEKVNEESSWKYWEDILSGKIILSSSQVAKDIWENVYFISEKFIAAHNDFSQDTVLFYGGFCFSHLGTWPEIEQTFGSGAYFGYNWRVKSNWNCALIKDLIASLTDTLIAQPITAEAWWSRPAPSKILWDNEDQRNCRILYSGDPGLKLLKDPELFYGKKYGGGIIFHLDESMKHGLIMAESDQSSGAPFGCYETLIGGTFYEKGYGQANTTILVNGCGEPGTAARICNDLVLNGYSDWYLPSAQELFLMYLASDDFGNFTAGSYYSSTEVNPRMAVGFTFYDGQYYNEFKNVPCNVRAIRSF